MGKKLCENGGENADIQDFTPSSSVLLTTIKTDLNWFSLTEIDDWAGEKEGGATS